MASNNDLKSLTDDILNDIEAPQPYAKQGDPTVDALANNILYGNSPAAINAPLNDANKDAEHFFGMNVDTPDLPAARQSMDSMIADNPTLLLQGKDGANAIRKRYRDKFPLVRPEKYQEPPLAFMAKAVLDSDVFNVSTQRAYEYEAKAQKFVSPQEYADYLDNSYKYRAQRMWGTVASTWGNLGANISAFGVANVEKIMGTVASTIMPTTKSIADIGDEAYKYMFGDSYTALVDDFKTMGRAAKVQGLARINDFRDGVAQWGPEDPTIPEKLGGVIASQMAFMIPGYGLSMATSGLGWSTVAARSVGAGAMTMLESGVEGGGVALDALKNGKSLEEAEIRGNIAFALNLPLNFVLDKMGLSIDEGSRLWNWIYKGSWAKQAVKGYAAGFAAEGTQEAAQLAISEPLGNDRWPTLGEFAEEFVYGGVFAGFGTALQALGAKPYRKAKVGADVTKALDEVAAGKNPTLVASIAQELGISEEMVIEASKKDTFVTEQDKEIFNAIAQNALDNVVDVNEVQVTDQDIEGVVSGEEGYNDVIARKITEDVANVEEATAVSNIEIEQAISEKTTAAESVRADILKTVPGIVSIEDIAPKDIVIEGQTDIRGIEHAFKLNLKNGSSVTVLWGGKQSIVNRRAVEAHGYKWEDFKGKPVGGQFVPSSIAGEDIISIGKLNDNGEVMTDTEKQRKLKHEVFHMIRKMLLDNKQMQILADRYADGDMTNEEAIARAYEIWDGKSNTSHGLFEMIRDFARKLVNLYKYSKFATAESIFSDIDSGKILEADKVAKEKGVGYSVEGPDASKRLKEISDTMLWVRKSLENAKLWTPIRIADALNNVAYVNEATPETLENLRKATGRRLERAMEVKFKHGDVHNKIDAYFAIGDTNGLGALYDNKNGVMIINEMFDDKSEKFDASVRRNFYYLLEDRGYISESDIAEMQREIFGATLMLSEDEKAKIIGKEGFDKVARANFYADHWQAEKGVIARISSFMKMVFDTLKGNTNSKIMDIMEAIDSGRILLRGNPDAKRVMYSIDDNIKDYYKLANHILDANKMADRSLINLHKSIVSDIDNANSDMVFDNEQIINNLRRKTRAAQGVKNVIKAMNDHQVLVALEKTEALLKKESEYGKKLGAKEATLASKEKIAEVRAKYKEELSNAKDKSAEKQQEIKDRYKAKIADLRENSTEAMATLKSQHGERLQALKDRYKNLIAERAKRQKENIAKNRIKSEIFNMLKTSQPKVVNGIKKGKYTAATQSIVDGIYKAYKFSQEARAASLAEWKLKYGRRLEAIKGKTDNRSKMVRARLNSLIDDYIATRTAPQILEKSRELNEKLMNGARVNSLEILGLQAELKMLNQLHKTNKETDLNALTEARDSVKGIIDFAKDDKKFFDLERHIKLERKLKDILGVLNAKSSAGMSDVSALKEAKRDEKMGAVRKFAQYYTASYQNMLELLSQYTDSNKLISAMELWEQKKDYWGKHTKMVNTVADLYREAYGVKSNFEIESVINDLAVKHDTGIVETDRNDKPVSLKISRGEAIQRTIELLSDETTNLIIENNYKGDIDKFNRMKSAVLGILTEQDKVFIEKVGKVYDEAYTLLNEPYRRQYGTDLPKTEFYVSIARDYQKAGKEISLDEQYQNIQSISPSAIHQRTRAKYPIKWQSIVPNLQRHTSNAVFYNVYAEKVYELNQLVYNPEVRATIIERFGQETFNNLKTHLESFVTGGKVDSAMDGMEWMAKLRSRFGVAVLSGKMKLMFTNATASAGYLAEVPTADFFKYLVTDSWNLIENHKFMLENSNYYRYRMDSFIDRDINEFMNSNETRSFLDRPSVTNWMLMNIKWGDRLGLLIGGIPTYKYYYNLYKKEMGESMAQKKAIETFERISEENQQSSSMDMLSIPEKSKNILLRALIQFTTQPRQYMAAEYVAMKEISRGKDVKKNLKRIAVYHFLTPALFQMVSDMFTGDDDKNRWWRMAIFGSWNNMLLLGSFAEQIYAAATGDKKGVQTKQDFALMSPLTKDLPEMLKDISAEEYFKAMRHAIDFGSKVTGVPAGTAIGMTIDLEEELNQTFGPDWEDILRIMGGQSRTTIEKNKGGK